MLLSQPDFKSDFRLGRGCGRALANGEVGENLVFSIDEKSQTNPDCCDSVRARTRDSLYQRWPGPRATGLNRTAKHREWWRVQFRVCCCGRGSPRADERNHRAEAPDAAKEDIAITRRDSRLRCQATE